MKVNIIMGCKSRNAPDACNAPGKNVGIKKPRRGEANYLPNPSAESDASLIAVELQGCM